MTQTPPTGPQVPGGQPPVPPQQPPAAPQPPATPQGYPQRPQQPYPGQGFGQQPVGYPQQQQPQQPYPQQPYPGQPVYQGQPQQQPYPGQPGYQGQQPYQGQQAYQGQQGYQGQQPYRPQGAGPGGYSGQQTPPAARASSSKILLIVIGAVLLLVLAGGVMLMMSNQSTPTVDPVRPSPGPVPTATASVQPTVPTDTTDPTTAPTTDPTTEPTTPSGGAVDLGNGVLFVPADGWEIQEQAPGAISVSNGKAVVVTRVVQQKKSTNPGQLCDSFNRQILAEAAGAKFGDPKDQEISLKNIGLASCPAAFVSTTNGKSQQMLVVTFGAVRTTDGIATLTTMLFTKDTPDATFDDIDRMLGIVLGTQSEG